MHGCFVRPVRGRVGLATRLALAGFALVLVAAARVTAEVRVPLPQLLIEAEQTLAAQQPADAAVLLDRVLTRVAAGESLPSGLAWDRVQLAAATAHFQSQGYGAAQQAAEALLKRQASGPNADEARLILGLALALQRNFAAALPVFAALEHTPAYRDRARLYRAMAAQEAGQIPVAIEAYTHLLATAPRNEDWAEAALVLVSLHLQEKNVAEAARGLERLQASRPLLDNLAGLNALCLQLGDACLERNEPDAAVAAYRLASPRERLLREQDGREALMRTRMERINAVSRPSPADLDALRRLQARLERVRAARAEIERATDYDAALYQRLGQAFLDTGAPWEAALAFADVLRATQDAAARARAHVALVRAHADAGRFARAEAALEAFAREAPTDPLVLQALYGLVMACQGRVEGPVQLRWLERAEVQPGSERLREPLVLLHAQALLTAGRLEEARLKAGGWPERFPDGSLREDAAYLHALAGMMSGRQERALDELAAFIRQYPGSRYEDDAAYRMAAAQLGLDRPEEAARSADAWLAARAPDHPQRGEVLALLGDARAATADLAGAVTAYREALRLPLPDELLGYVLDETTRHAQALGTFAEAAEMWETFARERPDHPFVLNAAYWIGRLRVREGRLPEALDSVAAIVRLHLADPSQDGVERLLVELAGLLVRARAGTASEVESLTHEGTMRLVGEEGPVAPVVRARLAFLSAELARLRQDRAARTAALDQLVAAAPVESLPAGLLGVSGDHLVESGRPEEAVVRFERLVAAYPRSVYADMGYTGLGDRALAEGRPADALRRYDDAIDRAGARTKLREASLGRARALLALGRFDEAREAFAAIAGEKAWRGEATAESVFNLGEILFRQGGTPDLTQAQAHFQRVYLSYRKYPVWVARAYLRSAETFARLGQLPEAAATLRELLRDERLHGLPEAALARRLLVDYDQPVLAGRLGPEES